MVEKYLFLCLRFSIMSITVYNDFWLNDFFIFYIYYLFYNMLSVIVIYLLLVIFFFLEELLNHIIISFYVSHFVLLCT